MIARRDNVVYFSIRDWLGITGMFLSAMIALLLTYVDIRNEITKLTVEVGKHDARIIALERRGRD